MAPPPPHLREFAMLVAAGQPEWHAALRDNDAALLDDREYSALRYTRLMAALLKAPLPSWRGALRWIACRQPAAETANLADREHKLCGSTRLASAVWRFAPIPGWEAQAAAVSLRSRLRAYLCGRIGPRLLLLRVLEEVLLLQRAPLPLGEHAPPALRQAAFACVLGDPLADSDLEQIWGLHGAVFGSRQPRAGSDCGTAAMAMARILVKRNRLRIGQLADEAAGTPLEWAMRAALRATPDLPTDLPRDMAVLHDLALEHDFGLMAALDNAFFGPCAPLFEAHAAANAKADASTLPPGSLARTAAELMAHDDRNELFIWPLEDPDAPIPFDYAEYDAPSIKKLLDGMQKHMLSAERRGEVLALFDERAVGSGSELGEALREADLLRRPKDSFRPETIVVVSEAAHASLRLSEAFERAVPLRIDLVVVIVWDETQDFTARAWIYWVKDLILQATWAGLGQRPPGLDDEFARLAWCPNWPYGHVSAKPRWCKTVAPGLHGCTWAALVAMCGGEPHLRDSRLMARICGRDALAGYACQQLLQGTQTGQTTPEHQAKH